MYKKTVIRALLILLTLGVFYFYREDIRQLNIPEIVRGVETAYLAALFVLGFFILKSILFFIPLFIICFSAGMVLPIQIALPLCYAGFLIEISLTYVFGYFLGNDLVEKLVARFRKFEYIMSRKDKTEVKVTFFSRLSPLAVEPVSLLLGAGNAHFGGYIVASLLGMTPRILVYTIIGNTVVEPINNFTIFVIVFILVVWGILLFNLRKRDFSDL